MKTTTLRYPGQVIFGNGSLEKFTEQFVSMNYKRAFLVTFPEILPALEQSIQKMKAAGIKVKTDTSIKTEPSFRSFEKVLDQAESLQADAVIGIGGGSILDVAKLIAAQLGNDQALEEITGINNLRQRATFLACLPTTSGTGSEMSPNAILLDEKANLKKGIVSPYLVPDISCIDPVLTVTVPSSVTAATGIDAFTHCLEAYVNKYAHPLVDTFALRGIQLIFHNLKQAVENGNDREARASVALGSMFGGMCLGPVNTTAIHALSYPLGSTYHIAHGLSNALLLTPVMEFNQTVSYNRYAQIARTLGIHENDDKKASTLLIERIRSWMKEMHIPMTLSEVNIPEEAIPDMARAAITIERLLKNNPRKVTFEDASDIYKNAY